MNLNKVNINFEPSKGFVHFLRIKLSNIVGSSIAHKLLSNFSHIFSEFLSSCTTNKSVPLSAATELGSTDAATGAAAEVAGLPVSAAVCGFIRVRVVLLCLLPT